MAILNQVIATGITCYLSISMGLMFAWPSCTITLFSSPNTTLHRPMTGSEVALLGSLSSVGAFISAPIAAYYLDRRGRKICSIASALTNVVSWAMIALSNRVEAVLAAIFVSGLGASVFLIVPVYVSEICQESIRGTMTSVSMIFYSGGMLISYALGGYVDYNTMVYIAMAMSVAGVLGLVLLKESPLYLMKKGFEEEAAKVVAYYRHVRIDDKEVLQEMDVMRRALNPDLDGDSEPETAQITDEKWKPVEIKEREKLSVWQFFKKSRSTRQAIFVVLTLSTASIFQGLAVVQVFAEPLFKQAVPTMSSTICSILFSIVTILAGILAAYLIDRAGRRPLMIHSSILGGISCALLGSQIQLTWAPHWVTALLIYIFTVVYTLGAGTVPFVLGPEVFLPEVKTFMSMVMMEWIYVCYFVILLIFNPLVGTIGLGNVFYIFALVCFLTAAFSIIYQPETKGLAVDEIQVLFLGRRKTARHV